MPQRFSFISSVRLAYSGDQVIVVGRSLVSQFAVIWKGLSKILAQANGTPTQLWMNIGKQLFLEGPRRMAVVGQ